MATQTKIQIGRWESLTGVVQLYQSGDAVWAVVHKMREVAITKNLIPGIGPKIDAKKVVRMAKDPVLQLTVLALQRCDGLAVFFVPSLEAEGIKDVCQGANELANKVKDEWAEWSKRSEDCPNLEALDKIIATIDKSISRCEFANRALHRQAQRVSSMLAVDNMKEQLEELKRIKWQAGLTRYFYRFFSPEDGEEYAYYKNVLSLSCFDPSLVSESADSNSSLGIFDRIERAYAFEFSGQMEMAANMFHLLSIELVQRKNPQIGLAVDCLKQATTLAINSPSISKLKTIEEAHSQVINYFRGMVPKNSHPKCVQISFNEEAKGWIKEVFAVDLIKAGFSPSEPEYVNLSEVNNVADFLKNRFSNVDHIFIIASKEHLNTLNMAHEQKPNMIPILYSQTDGMQSCASPSGVIKMRNLSYGQYLEKFISLFCQALKVDEGSEILKEHTQYLLKILLLGKQGATRPATPLKFRRIVSEIPQPVKNFVGRLDELNKIKKLFKKNHCVVIKGLGGIGKTQLSYKYLKSFENEGKYNLVWLIKGDSREALVKSSHKLAKVLDIDVDPDSSEPNEDIARQLKEKLSRYTSMVLFDNIDTEESADCAKLYCPSTGQVLVTGRFPAVEGLLNAQGFHLGPLSEQDGVEYLIEQTNQRDDESSARKISKKLAGLPLALSHAAAYITQTQISLEEYFSIIESDYHLLDSKITRTDDDYPETIYRTWQPSIDRIKQSNPFAIDLLGFLSAFDQNQFEISLLEKWINKYCQSKSKIELFDAIRSLCDYSLIHRPSLSNATYMIHPLVCKVVAGLSSKEDPEAWERIKDQAKVLSKITGASGIRAPSEEDEVKARAVGELAQKIKATSRSSRDGHATEIDWGFGAKKWAKYIGEVGEEPPLPENLEQILKSPCPYWEGKQIKDTHMLTLIPATVNGKELTLERLGELVKTPKAGHAGHYTAWYPRGNEKAKADRPYWALMTKDVIPETRTKIYDKQRKLLKAGYEAPKLIEAAVSIFMAYVSEKEELYKEESLTYTRCQETASGADWQMAVGGSAGGGLDVLCYMGVHDSYGLAGVRRL